MTGRRWMAIAAATALAAALSPVPAIAYAGAGCTHRGGAHVARHGGRVEDDRFHVMHGELPTCDGDSGDDDTVVSDAERVADVARSDGPGLPSVPGHSCRHIRCTHHWWRND